MSLAEAFIAMSRPEPSIIIMESGESSAKVWYLSLPGHLLRSTAFCRILVFLLFGATRVSRKGM
jgi:hypothetical protein